MTDSDPPPGTGERASTRLRAAAVRAPDKPELSAPSTVPLPDTGIVAKPSNEPLRSSVVNSLVNASANTLANAGTLATATVRPPRVTVVNAAKPARPPPEAPANAAPANAVLPKVVAPKVAAPNILPQSIAPPAAVTANPVTPVAAAPAAPPRRSLLVSESYPGPADLDAAAAAEAKNSKRITPRSPRTALEPDHVEAPVRRSKSARHPFVVFGNAVISIFVLLAIAAIAALVLGNQRFETPGPLPEDRIVNIPHGSGIRDIADALVRNDVIDQPWVFIGGVLVLKAREDLKAGEYQFKAHASLRDVIATIIDGRVVTHQITIPEGLTSEQIVARLLADDILAGNVREIPREGSLLPDTYNFSRGLTREQMIQRMQQSEQRALKEIWDHRAPDLPIKTPEQLVILASLIEKETGKAEERTRVAAVFVNRLKQKMRLQSDPTIIYGLVGGKGTLGRPILKSEIDQPTPYNTYQIEGLPPGPIANPGHASLEAAANPARTRELYFVADGTGGHAFADTYEQHQKNVARLRQSEMETKDQSTGDAQLVSSPPQAAPAASAPAASTRRPGRRR